MCEVWRILLTSLELLRTSGDTAGLRMWVARPSSSDEVFPAKLAFELPHTLGIA